MSTLGHKRTWLDEFAIVRLTPDSGHEANVQGYGCIEDLGDRVVLLGVASHSSKTSFVEVGHFGAQR